MSWRSMAGAAFFVGVAGTLSGCVGAGDQSREQEREREQDRTEATVQSEERKENRVEEWMNALAGGKRMQCRYTVRDESGKETTATMAMERNRYRIEMQSEVGTYVVVDDGAATYSWAKEGKQGMKMERACLEELAKESPTADTAPQDVPDYDSPEDALESIPDIACEETDSVDFSIPGDVVFTDQCEMIRQTKQMMQQYERQIPGNLPGAGAMPNVPPMPR